jgi:hypothetical protein
MAVEEVIKDALPHLRVEDLLPVQIQEDVQQRTMRAYRRHRLPVLLGIVGIAHTTSVHSFLPAIHVPEEGLSDEGSASLRSPVALA